MRFRVVSDLVAHSGLEGEGSSICKFGVEFSLCAQEDVAL